MTDGSKNFELCAVAMSLQTVEMDEKERDAFHCLTWAIADLLRAEEWWPRKTKALFRFAECLALIAVRYETFSLSDRDAGSLTLSNLSPRVCKVLDEMLKVGLIARSDGVKYTKLQSRVKAKLTPRFFDVIGFDSVSLEDRMQRPAPSNEEISQHA